MTLDAIYMPAPAKVKGRRIAPLGAWPEPAKSKTAEEREARRKESWREYADKNREQRIAYMREYRARKVA